MRSLLCSGFLILCATLPAGGDGQLRLKSRSLDTERGWSSRLAEPVKRRALGRSHVLLRFAGPPRLDELRELERRGATLLRYVPDFGLMASIEDGADLEDLGLQWAGRLRPEDKISPAMTGSGRLTAAEHFVVEFHPDIGREEAASLAAQHGFGVLDHPDLLPDQLLLFGPADQVRSLAEWDEVAYVFPASEELVEGHRVRACAGAMTALGLVANYAGRVSEGWDGPGRNSAELGYFFQRLHETMPVQTSREEIRRALAEWAKYASLTFRPAAAPTSLRTLNVLVARGEHGDPYPFDGRGRVLAHSYYPAPPNPEPVAGDMHFDEEEEWAAGAGLTASSVDLFSVALHETGHALGLTHSDYPGTVMYPYYRRVTALAAEDILRIQELYAAPGDTPGGAGSGDPPAVGISYPSVFPFQTTAGSIFMSGSVAGGSGEPQVAWSSDRGASGIAQGGRSWTIPAVPLQPGDNTITVTAIDAAQQRSARSVVIERRVEEVPFAVRITAPASGSSYSTPSPSITLSGTASPSSTVVRVEWSSSRGSRGTASGTATWTAGPVALLPGSNVITVSAFDAQERSVSASLDVTHLTGSPDTVAPSLTVTSPATANVLTYAATISLRGTASDNAGVTRVTWETFTGQSGVATGTTSWNVEALPLLVGTNRIIVRASDAAGNTAWRSLTVTRR